MGRAPFQVLVFPYRRSVAGTFEYAIFRRTDLGVWQAIAGGGEGDERPEATAAREAYEEAGIPSSAPFMRLTGTGAIPVEHFRDRHLWEPGLRTIPEYAFGVEIDTLPITMSGEHCQVAWLDVERALTHLEWESNRAALLELHGRLNDGRGSQ